MKDFTCYAIGVCCASVCTSLPLEEATARLNAEQPTGIGPWELSGESFATGESNPCPCNVEPETHTHYLFVC